MANAERSAAFLDAAIAGRKPMDRDTQAMEKFAHFPLTDSNTGIRWETPNPLPDALPPVAPFDSALLPDSMRGWISDITDRVQCPPDFPAVGAMIALGSLVGRRIAIRPKIQDDWHEVGNLWGCIIGRPGIFKTPALAEALRPLQRLEADARKLHEAELADWSVEKELARIKKDAARANAMKAAKTGGTIDRDSLQADDEDEEPAAMRYVVNDCSVEALGEILRKNPNGVLAYRDELIGLLKSLDKEGNEGARSFFLSAWTGKEPHTFDRIGRGLNLRIDACCLSMLGSIQPSVISSYLRSAVDNAGADGLLSRFQLLVWPDVSGDWKNVDRWPDTAAKQRAFAAFAGIQSVDARQISGPLEADDLPYLRYAPGAQAAFNVWRVGFELRLRREDDHPALIAHLSKYRKLVPSLSLIFELADRPAASSVSEESLLRALSWAEYLETHARRAYSSVTRPDIQGAKALLAKIRSGAVQRSFGLKDVYDKGWTYLSDPEAARKAAEVLEQYDYLRSEQIQTPGRWKLRYLVNPKGLGQ